MSIKSISNCLGRYAAPVILILGVMVVLSGLSSIGPVSIDFPYRKEPAQPIVHPAKPVTPSSITTTFDPDLDLYLSGPAGNDAWNKMMLEDWRGGFLKVRHNETNAPGWGVSMLHGLHCLQLLKLSISMLLDSHNNRSATAAGHADHLDFDHLEHCLGYVAQVSSF